MDRRGAKRFIAAAGARGSSAVEFSTHALFESMPDDGVSACDVLHVLANVDDVLPQNDHGRRWKVYGPVVAGDRYAVVVLLLDVDRLRVITSHDPP